MTWEGHLNASSESAVESFVTEGPSRTQEARISKVEITEEEKKKEEPKEPEFQEGWYRIGWQTFIPTRPYNPDNDKPVGR